MSLSIVTPTNSILSYDDLVEENFFLNRQLKELLEDKSHLEELVRLLKRQRFAPKSEIVASGQGTLFNEAEAIVAEDAAQDSSDANTSNEPDKPKKKRGKPIRRPLPTNLPRVDSLIDLPESKKFCPLSGEALVKIGEEITEQLDIKPAEAFVMRFIRPKYVCKCSLCQAKIADPGSTANEGTVKIVALPPQPIAKSFASAGLLAYIATAKYDDASPLYRQEGIFSRIGVDLCRSTMATWMVRLGDLVKPLITLAKEELIGGPAILCDETRVQVLKGTGKKSTAKSYMWCFMGGTATQKKIILYELGPGRSHEVPLKFLDGFSGYLHTDGYEAYETLAAKMPSVILVGDWVHARRKFNDAIKSLPIGYKGVPIAKTGLDMINELFRIERVDIGDGASDEDRHRIRQEKSRVLCSELKVWADETMPTIRPKSLSGKAILYMLERWVKLTRFLDTPILRIDTNPVENAIRPFVIGRKNWLFSDTFAGAEASAALYSLISMAKANGLNSFLYLKAIFTALPHAKTIEDFDALLPWIWKPDAEVSAH